MTAETIREMAYNFPIKPIDRHALSFYLRIVHCFDVRRQSSFDGDIHGRPIPSC